VTDVVIVNPTFEPVSVQEMRDDLRLFHVDDDRKIVRYIREAREWLEVRVGVSLITQTREAVHELGNEALKGPVQEIVSEDTDDEGVTTITYVAGWETREAVPGPLKAALRLKVQELYDGVDNTRAIDDLLANFNAMVA
jgi:hypothetical protein